MQFQNYYFYKILVVDKDVLYLHGKKNSEGLLYCGPCYEYNVVHLHLFFRFLENSKISNFEEKNIQLERHLGFPHALDGPSALCRAVLCTNV